MPVPPLRSVSVRRLPTVCQHVAFGLLTIWLAGIGAVTNAHAELRHTITASHAQASHPTDSVTVQNLRAFTKLYGTVRFFHPSDAASGVDWNRFAIHGTRAVADAETPADLARRLEALFLPIAPTLQLYRQSDVRPSPRPVLELADTTGLALVAWQHKGVGLGNRGPYRSIRLSRSAETPDPSGFSMVMKRIDATPHQGKQVRLRAAVRTQVEGAGNTGRLLLRVDRASGEMGFFDNMQDRPITDSTWTTYDITGEVADDAEQIYFGGLLTGQGTAQMDAFQLQVRDTTDADWTSVPVKNAGFEAGDAGASPNTWQTRDDGYRVVTADAEAVDGDQSVVLASSSEGATTELFDARPAPGTVVDTPLARGLVAQVPLALYSRDGQTLRPDDAPSPASLQAALGSLSIDSLSAHDAGLRYGNVATTWAILQHFYPYFDVVDVDWGAALTQTLQRTLTDRDTEDHLRTLQFMMAQLDDGHGSVFHPSLQETAPLPLRVDRIEDEIVITAVEDSLLGDDPCIQRGDVVTTLDGEDAETRVAEAKRFISGSPQWTEYRALGGFGRGERGTETTITVQREGQEQTCTLTRSGERRPSESKPAPIDTLRDGVYYVDLDRAPTREIDTHMEMLAAAKGVVFDLRGYPEGGNQRVLQHLSTDTLRSARWQIPQIIYPDREDLVGYDTSGRWTLPPLEPQFTGKVVFLTNARAISYAESIMGIVEHYDLADIVGQPTAGANGNVNPFTLPGDYRIAWTGMRVLKHDRSQHHLIGIRPTVSVTRTIEAVRDGRDRYLETARDLIEEASTSR